MTGDEQQETTKRRLADESREEVAGNSDIVTCAQQTNRKSSKIRKATSLDERERSKEFIILSEIIYDILLRLPGTSIFSCRCVSKSWRNLISDPTFCSAYSKRANLSLLLAWSKIVGKSLSTQINSLIIQALPLSIMEEENNSNKDIHSYCIPNPDNADANSPLMRFTAKEWNIILFDVISETFRLMAGPTLGAVKRWNMNLFELQGRLALSNHFCATLLELWVLEDYNKEIWVKKHTINLSGTVPSHLETDMKAFAANSNGNIFIRAKDFLIIYNVYNQSCRKLSSKHPYMFLNGFLYKDSLIQHDFFKDGVLDIPPPIFAKDYLVKT